MRPSICLDACGFKGAVHCTSGASCNDSVLLIQFPTHALVLPFHRNQLIKIVNQRTTRWVWSLKKIPHMHMDNRTSILKQSILSSSTLRHQAWAEAWHLASYTTQKPQVLEQNHLVALKNALISPESQPSRCTLLQILQLSTWTTPLPSEKPKALSVWPSAQF